MLLHADRREEIGDSHGDMSDEPSEAGANSAPVASARRHCLCPHTCIRSRCTSMGDVTGEALAEIGELYDEAHQGIMELSAHVRVAGTPLF